ncbi:metallophosphoesterase family protein [Actinomadura sp. CNU-125]|uniref:metallophosphoesterase family protein n=1 Tax=Actinomadura sp. CNU-125 TaxID=1904961 RepID=UPI0021CCC49D|nr:metallophosphoesterase family protein [Actinomadura sp. CNU-125]
MSDVHGRAEALRSAADGADALICLGDLILFIDYDDHAQGIFADLFGRANADRFIELRTLKRFDERARSPATCGPRWRGTRGRTSRRPSTVSTRNCSRRCRPPPT